MFYTGGFGYVRNADPKYGPITVQVDLMICAYHGTVYYTACLQYSVGTV